MNILIVFREKNIVIVVWLRVNEPFLFCEFKIVFCYLLWNIILIINLFKKIFSNNLFLLIMLHIVQNRMNNKINKEIPSYLKMLNFKFIEYLHLYVALLSRHKIFYKICTILYTTSSYRTGSIIWFSFFSILLQLFCIFEYNYIWLY